MHLSSALLLVEMEGLVMMVPSALLLLLVEMKRLVMMVVVVIVMRPMCSGLH